MTQFKGRYACVTVNALTTEAVVAEINKQNVSRQSDTLDTPVFGNDGWGRSTVGVKKYSGSFDGYYDPSDTDGQAVLEDSWENGTVISDIRLYYKYSTTSGETVYYDKPTTGTGNGIIITNIERSIDVNGVGEISFSYEGCGPLESVTTVLP
jgi:hypothetical protein